MHTLHQKSTILCYDWTVAVRWKLHKSYKLIDNLIKYVMTIYKDVEGYFIVEGIGNRIYLPECMQNIESIDFMSDYLMVAINDTTL